MTESSTIQVSVERLKELVEENQGLSYENDRLQRRVKELEQEVRHLRKIWGEEDTAPGIPRRK